MVARKEGLVKEVEAELGEALALRNLAYNQASLYLLHSKIRPRKICLPEECRQRPPREEFPGTCSG